jgi:hypothetical protein
MDAMVSLNRGVLRWLCPAGERKRSGCALFGRRRPLLKKRRPLQAALGLVSGVF